MEHNGKVLVVDDEPDFTEFLEWQLRKTGYEIMVGNSGAEGLNLILAHVFDVLIADIRMPGMDGLELITRSLKRQPDLQCIVITGHGDVDTAIDAMRAGAVNYLRKPVGIDEIQIAIEKAMEKLKLIRENRDKQVQLENANKELGAIRQQLEKSLNNETASRQKAEKEIEILKLREVAVELLYLSLRYWKLSTKKTKIDFAEESSIWTAAVDSSGTYRTRTLDKYLKASTLPKNPRYNDVLDSAYFILSACNLEENMMLELKEKISGLEQLINVST